MGDLPGPVAGRRASLTLTPSWSQVRFAGSATSPLRGPVAALLAVVPVAVQLVRLGHPLGRVVQVVVIVGLGVVVAQRSVRWWWVVGAVLATGVVIVDTLLPDRALAFVCALGFTWSVALGVVGCVDGVAGALSRRLALVPLVIADVLLLVATGFQVPITCLASAVVVLLAPATLPRPLEAPAIRLSAALAPIDRLAGANSALLRRIGRPAGAVLGGLVMVPAAALVGLAWGGQRLARFDPLEAPTLAAGRWVRRAGGDPGPGRGFSAAPISDQRGPTRAIRRTAASLFLAVPIGGLAVALAMAVVDGRFQWSSNSEATGAIRPQRVGDGCELPRRDPVMDGQPGTPLLQCESWEFVARARFEGATNYRYPDFRSRWVNERDGVRTTWRAPACACRRVSMWWFGGSAAWGWYQRDEFSLPSQLARVAWEHGIALDITNYAMPAWVLGQEVNRFEEVSAKEPLPDLVVFYDGGNELNRQKERNGRGQGADESATSFLEAEIDDFLWNGPPPEDDSGIWNRSTSREPGKHLTPEAVARHAMKRYQRDVELGRRVAGTFGLDPVFIWQPLSPSAPRAASRPGALDAADTAEWDRMLPAALDHLPPGVVNLADALDEVDRPVFEDVFHTNEDAALIVARRIYEELDERIVATQGQRNG